MLERVNSLVIVLSEFRSNVELKKFKKDIDKIELARRSANTPEAL